MKDKNKNVLQNVFIDDSIVTCTGDEKEKAEQTLEAQKYVKKFVGVDWSKLLSTERVGR